MTWVYADYDFEKSILLFKDRINKDGIIMEVRARRFYLTRSQRRKVKDIEAAKRRRRREQRR